MTREEFARFLDWVKSVSLAFDGSAYRTMLRNDAYWFTRLGTAIERADNTARILDVKYHVSCRRTSSVGGSLDYFQWTTILREVSALTAYHWVYRESVKPWLVADLLILNAADAALARQLLRDPGAPSRSDRRRLRPPRPEPAAGQHHAGAALERRASRSIFQRGPARVRRPSSSTRTTGLAPAITEQYLM